MEKPTRLSIIGTGNFGSAAAYEMLGKVEEIYLFNRHREKAKGTYLDLSDAAVSTKTRVYDCEKFSDLPNDGISLVSIKEAYDYRDYKPEDLRVVGLRNDVPLVRSVAKHYTKNSYNGIVIVGSNPADVMTRIFAEHFDSQNGSRVFGFGSNLDSLRARQIISRYANADPLSVDITVIGEHGDSMVPVYSQARIGRKPLLEYNLDFETIKNTLRKSGATIVKQLGHSKFGPAKAFLELHEFLQKENPKNLLSMSTLYKDGIYIGLPVQKIGDSFSHEFPHLNSLEMQEFKKSLEKLVNMYNFAKQFDTDKQLRKLLVVDDEPGAADSLKSTLENLVANDDYIYENNIFNYFIATSAEEAMKIIDQQKDEFDLIISDQRMPGQDGISFLLDVKSKYPRTNSLILSGYLDDVPETFSDTQDMLNKLSSKGIEGFIKKPFNPDVDWPKIKQILEKTQRIIN